MSIEIMVIVLYVVCMIKIILLEERVKKLEQKK
jgi:hypothetical protein